MKNLVISFVFAFCSFVGFSQTIADSLNNLIIVSMVPNIAYLKFVPNIYIPTNDDFRYNPEVIVPTETILKERYKCSVVFLESSIDSNGVNDPIFEVTTSEGASFGILNLKLSVMEELHQNGILNEQVNLYCKYTDIMYSRN